MRQLTKQIDKGEFLQSWNRIKEKLTKHSNVIYYVVLSLILFLYFFINFSDAMHKGGRWDMNQHIAMADRFLQGEGFYYSAEEASTTYFPGIAFLAIPVRLIFGGMTETVMLVLASLIGTAFFYILVRIATDHTQRRWFSLFLTSAVFFSRFEYYRYYMNEFKGDSLICIYAFLIINIISKLEKVEIGEEGGSDWKAGYVWLFILSFLMDITKQQALYIDVALGMYLVFTRKLSVKRKMKTLAVMVGGGVLSLVVMLPIPGFKLLTIDNLNQMPWWDKEHIFDELTTVFSEYQWVYYAVILLLILLVLRKVKFSSRHIMWMCVSILFFIAQLAGGMKIGGNIGNYQAGIVGLVPFFVIIVFEAIRFFIRDKRQIWITAVILIVMVLRLSDAMGQASFQNLNARSENYKAESEYLSKYYSGETIMYDSDHYFEVKNSDCIPGMDLYTVPYYLEEQALDLEKALQEKRYPVLMIYYGDLKEFDQVEKEYFDRDTYFYKALTDNYELENHDDIPMGLKNRIYVIKDR
ncbi:MAG: hypothetical protein IJM27_04295 [Eubacterium sp.]|nr:hypothetical protein [Eubacterium sp.]